MSEQRQQEQESSSKTQWIDGRVLPSEPVVKTSNPYTNSPEYLCPHCCCDISGSSSAWGEEEDGVPEDVTSHIRQCDGLKTYHLGLKARRKQKARWLARHRAEQ